MVWLLPRAQSIDNITFDVDMLLLAGVAVMLGFNVLLLVSAAPAFRPISKPSSLDEGR